MPRKKAEEVKKDEELEEVVVNEEVASKEETVSEDVSESVDFEPVTYENATVVRILETGHTETHFHCEMSDRTTKHVPKTLFPNA